MINRIIFEACITYEWCNRECLDAKKCVLMLFSKEMLLNDFSISCNEAGNNWQQKNRRASIIYVAEVK